MASSSIPQFYSDYTFSSDFSSQFSYPFMAGDQNCGGGDASSSSGTISSGAISNNAIWGDQESFPISYDHHGILLPSESDVVLSPGTVMSSFPEHLGIMSDSAVTTLPEYNNMAGLCGISGIINHQNFGSRFQLPDACEFGDECCGFVQDFKPVYPASADYWGNQNNEIQGMEEANIKIGRYSVEERKDRIIRYLKKKNQRNFNKTIKYACRKTLADRRVRVRGRFARNNEITEEEMVMMKNNVDNNSHQDHNNESSYYAADAVQMIKQDEEWMQEAMASLMYLPYNVNYGG